MVNTSLRNLVTLLATVNEKQGYLCPYTPSAALTHCHCCETFTDISQLLLSAQPLLEMGLWELEDACRGHDGVSGSGEVSEDTLPNHTRTLS